MFTEDRCKSLKRYLALALILSIIISLCGCINNSQSVKVKNNGTDAHGNTAVSSDYSSIAQRDIHSITWQTVCCTHKDSGTEMNISFPNDWSFEQHDGSYNIIRSGKVIGTVSSNPSPIPQKKYEVKSGSVDKLKYNRSIHQNGNEFTYVICFSYTADTTITRVTVEVDYSEFCNAAVTRMINDSLLFSVTDNIRGDFTVSPKNTSTRFLVCGNSFIGSSQLIQWFNQMCQASHNGYSMQSGTAVSLSTDGSYSNEDVKNGKYAAVFLCGFYSNDQFDILSKIKKLCKESNTLLVIFPAHNEVPSLVDKALQENPDLAYIGWQAEIQDLIDLGIDYDLMCIDDTHKHTTHLGGYVGAHMIYRTMFKDNPPKISGTGSLSYDDVKRQLGDYVTTGDPYSIRNNQTDLKLKF